MTLPLLVVILTFSPSGSAVAVCSLFSLSSFLSSKNSFSVVIIAPSVNISGVKRCFNVSTIVSRISKETRKLPFSSALIFISIFLSECEILFIS
jgi:hypothetical protein